MSNNQKVADFVKEYAASHNFRLLGVLLSWVFLIFIDFHCFCLISGLDPFFNIGLILIIPFALTGILFFKKHYLSMQFAALKIDQQLISKYRFVSLFERNEELDDEKKELLSAQCLELLATKTPRDFNAISFSRRFKVFLFISIIWVLCSAAIFFMKEQRVGIYHHEIAQLKKIISEEEYDLELEEDLKGLVENLERLEINEDPILNENLQEKLTNLSEKLAKNRQEQLPEKSKPSQEPTPTPAKSKGEKSEAKSGQQGSSENEQGEDSSQDQRETGQNGTGKTSGQGSGNEKGDSATDPGVNSNDDEGYEKSKEQDQGQESKLENAIDNLSKKLKEREAQTGKESQGQAKTKDSPKNKMDNQDGQSENSAKDNTKQDRKDHGQEPSDQDGKGADAGQTKDQERQAGLKDKNPEQGNKNDQQADQSDQNDKTNEVQESQNQNFNQNSDQGMQKKPKLIEELSEDGREGHFKQGLNNFENVELQKQQEDQTDQSQYFKTGKSKYNSRISNYQEKLKEVRDATYEKSEYQENIKVPLEYQEQLLD